MINITEVNPNILFKRIKNQFLAAIIGIILLVISSITFIVLDSNIDENTKNTAIIAMLLIAVLSAYIVVKLYKASQTIQESSDNHEKDMAEASHNLWRLIVGMGEVCLESDIPNNKRIFVSDALSQVIEIELEDIEGDNYSLKQILQGIKSSSDSEIKQKKTISLFFKGDQ